MIKQKPRHTSEKTTFSQELYCREPTCDNHTKDHKWAAIRAKEAGWFFSKEGWATCPDHPPEWLVEWREQESRRVLRRPG